MDPDVIAELTAKAQSICQFGFLESSRGVFSDVLGRLL